MLFSHTSLHAIHITCTLQYITLIYYTCAWETGRPWTPHPEHVSHPLLGGLRAGGGAAGIITVSGTGGTTGQGASSEPTQEITHLYYYNRSGKIGR